MNTVRLDQAIADAVAAGILPEGATWSTIEHRPWSVMILTALGAWLAAIPLMAIVFITLGGILSTGIGPYLLGLVLLFGATSLLRKKNVSLFLEQLAIPALLAGGITLGIGIWGDFPEQLGSAAMALVAIGIAVAVPRQWLRILLGAASCVLMIVAIWPNTYSSTVFQQWFALHVVLGIWLAARLRVVPLVIESLATGWGIALLAGLAVWSGMTFLLDASLQLNQGSTADVDMPGPTGFIAQAVSSALAGLAVYLLSRRWPTLRGPWFLGSGVVMVGMSFMMPSLGATLLMTAVTAGQQRWKSAAAGGIAAAWIIGAFYYQANLSLGTKAFIMVGAGAVLGAIAWFALRDPQHARNSGDRPSGTRRSAIAIAGSALLVLLVANIGILQKENLIANGKPVFVELAPVDPRSLMQGDFMRLAYQIPPFTNPSSLSGAARPTLTGRLDARRIFTAERVVAGRAAGGGVVGIELTPSGSGWTIASNAWYFKEGEAARWSKARYAEFRVDDNGRALLVNLRGPALEGL